MATAQITLLALRDFAAYGERRVAGEYFSAPAVTAVLLVAARHAQFSAPLPALQVPATRRRRTYARKDLVPEA
jgi:hypothetical protein